MCIYMYNWSAGSLCLYGFECASELSINMTATRCVQHIQLFYKTDINSSRHNLVHNRICELNRPCGPVVHKSHNTIKYIHHMIINYAIIYTY